MGEEAVAVSLLTEVHGPVGWLVFNRPEAGNAMTAAMMEALPRAWSWLAGAPEVRAIVVTGAGRAFQTGLDVVQLSREPSALTAMSRRTRRADLRLTGWHLGVEKPIITAVNGVCAGGGLHFVADSDIVIASSAASFLDPHVSVGQVSAFETIGLARRAAFGAAARMALTGAHERLGAADAYRLGWVSEVVEPAELRPAAQRLGELIARDEPSAVAARKKALWRALETGLTEARGGRA
ncbi:enoyl-CoA hydratase/isomerase family protein [Actinomadura sp. DC4]|uniref:enoyl-CoA hydratase/isomerase family protein n=1 Tax=Actinomadura sp. DC4 TaxID=3055069 RepID=UPI0025B001AE|nr:enoyl-CoA hydratase/isomerase family protein [Actinomadura sp. DC4]MDN3357566.1 enoyl-CoA hydratase/isomerase family protein [Actinomadura sp. DC4]